MVLSAEEARVVACLVEKETTVPDSYPLTLNALRLACNQIVQPRPDRRLRRPHRRGRAAVAQVDGPRPLRPPVPRRPHDPLPPRRRRAVAPVAGRARRARRARAARPADRRRGPRPCRAPPRATSRPGPSRRSSTCSAARSPDPFAVRVERRPGEREGRWAHALSGRPVDEPTLDAEPAVRRRPLPAPAPRTDLARDVAELWRRVERLERQLGPGRGPQLVASASSGCARRGPAPGCSCSSACPSAGDRRGTRGRGASRTAGSAPRCAP